MNRNKQMKNPKVQWPIRLVNHVSWRQQGLNWAFKKISIFQKMALKLCKRKNDINTKITIWYGRPRDWKRSVFIPIPKKGGAKECSSYHTIALSSHASKVMLQILQARLQQYVKQELPDDQVGFRKGRETQISNCQHPLDHGKSKQIPKKKNPINYASLTLLKPLTVWTTTNCGKFLKIWEYQTVLSASWEILYRSRSNS